MHHLDGTPSIANFAPTFIVKRTRMVHTYRARFPLRLVHLLHSERPLRQMKSCRKTIANIIVYRTALCPAQSYEDARDGPNLAVRQS